MTSIPAVKITRAGIEVNEVPTDLSVLEGRMDAVEAKNQEQDAIFETNDGRIIAVKSTADANATRLGDLADVESAVETLQALSHTEVSLDSVNDAITALQDASVSNAATIVAVQNAIDDLTTAKANQTDVTAIDAAIDALEALNPNDVSVTTLATKAQVDLKKSDGSKSTFGTEFKATVTGILDNSVFPADQDWANTYSLTTYKEAVPHGNGNVVTGFAGISATNNPDKKSINMGLVIENDADRFEHYAGIRGLGTSDVESEAFSNAHLIQFNNTIPFAMTIGKAMSAGNKLDRETTLNDIIPNYSNLSVIQVVRELSPVESSFYVDSGEATAPVILSKGQSIRKINLYDLKTTGIDNRYTPSVYDRSNVAGNSYVIVEPAEDATVEHCLSQSLGLWTNRADVNSAAYKLRTSMEFETIDALIASEELPSNVYTEESSNYTMGGNYSMYTYVIGAPYESLHAFKRLEKFVDRWSDKEYVLEAPHGVMQYDIFQYTVPAVIEHLYLSEDEKLDHANARTAWDITKEEVFDVVGLDVANGSHTNLDVDDYWQFPTGQYGSTNFDLASGSHDYYSYETENPFGNPFIPEASYAAIQGKYTNFNAVNYMSVDDVMKLCRVLARRGVMENGVRLINPDIFEALFQCRMTVEQPITAVSLDGTVDNCYGSLWRGVSCFGAPVRGPGVLPAEAYLRNDRATDLVKLSVGGTVPVIAAGDLTTWVVETPPQRCIVMPISANTGNYVTIYPDSHTVSLILTDDGIETRLAEYKSISAEIYKHLTK